jgi:hypothetical protein
MNTVVPTHVDNVFAFLADQAVCPEGYGGRVLDKEIKFRFEDIKDKEMSTNFQIFHDTI